MLDYNFFVDEAGHTGEDLIKSDQLFFTMGAIGIPVKDLPFVESITKRLMTKHKIDFELKGKKLIGTKFEPIIPEIFNELFNIDFLPVFTVLEKRFMIAGKIVENFFDPAYNINTDSSWTLPIPRKVIVANYFYDVLSKNTIEMLATAMVKGTLDELKNSYELLLSETKNKEYKRLLKGVENQLFELSQALSKNASGTLHDIASSVMNSPNYTIYYEHLNKIEHLLRLRNKKGDIVFDSSREFNKPFATLFEQLRTAKQNKLEFPGNTLYFGFQNLVGFDHKDSKDIVFIQLADILATSVNSFFRKLHRRENFWKLNKSEEFWMGYIYILLEYDFGNWIISSKLKQKYGKLVNQFLNDKKTIHSF